MANWLIFDMDEVLVNGRDIIADHLNQHTGKSIPVSDWDRYDLCEIYDIDLDTLVSVLHSSNAIVDATIEPNAQEAINLARYYGYKVGVLTARGWHADGMQMTINAFEKFGLSIDHVVAVPLKARKHEVIAQHFPGTIKGFVDDNLDHINGVASLGIPSYVRDRPWNQDAQYPNRTFDLIEFVETIKSKDY